MHAGHAQINENPTHMAYGDGKSSFRTIQDKTPDRIGSLRFGSARKTGNAFIRIETIKQPDFDSPAAACSR